VPRVAVHTTDDAPTESRETLERQGERVGKVINIFAEMAHAPALLKMYDTTETLLREESSLDEATRQAIHLTVANVNDATWQAALDAGWSEKELLEGYADVIRTIMTNYFNHMVGTELDLPEAPALD